MGKYIRIFIAIIAVLSLLLLARNKAAEAGSTASGDNGAAGAELSASAASNDDCDDDQKNGKEKEKCKDKDDKDDQEDDDGEDDDEDDDDGTVIPPDDDIEVCKRGDYSVGGVATLEVKNVKDRGQKDDCFNAHSESSGGVSGLPKNAGPVLSDLVVLESLGQGSNVKICFAAPPGKKVKIYFTGQNSWKPVGTQVKNGIACAHVPASGSYVLAGK